jgi:hypothetical protein
MAFSRHSNPSSHIAYVRAGHNSDYNFQKAVSGAPMPKKKEILARKAMATKVAKMKKTRLQQTPRRSGRVVSKPSKFKNA